MVAPPGGLLATARLGLIAEEISDGRVLRLIRSFLEAGVIVDGAWEPTKTGVPQGGVASRCDAL
jgi:hypothetical protein